MTPTSISLSPSEQLAYSTLRLECWGASGSASMGTGFTFRLLENQDTHVPVIVTNKHVLAGATRGRFLLHCRGSTGLPERSAGRWVELADFDKAWIGHPDPDVDLAIVPIAPLLNTMLQHNARPFFIPLDGSMLLSRQELAELAAVEDVLMIGYPNGIWDSHNNSPIMRRGITATHAGNDYEGRKEFLVDAPVFPGSSGSPVLLYNIGTHSDKAGNTHHRSRVKLLGVLRAAFQHSVEGQLQIVDVPTVERLVATSNIPNNLGLVIKAERLLEFESLLKS